MTIVVTAIEAGARTMSVVVALALFVAGAIGEFSFNGADGAQLWQRGAMLLAAAGVFYLAVKS